MSTGNFITSFTVHESAAQVYAAICKVSEWWQGEVSGPAEKLNDEFDYRMKDIHYSRQRVIELVPNKRVVWSIVASNLSSFTQNTEWTGTKVIFEISSEGGETKFTFTHEGLVPKFQCYGDCSYAWEQLIQKSLHSLITSGKGKKVF